LETRSNCTYSSDYIMSSNCSNGIGFLTFQGGTRGTCGPGGFCICNEGYTGMSDWVNLDGKDCQISRTEIRGYAVFGLVGTLWLDAVAFRLVHKAYANSKKDWSFKAMLKKTLIQIAIAIAILSTPLLIYCIVQIFSPATIMIDPAINPIFFTFTYLCLNAEWWLMATVLISLIKPFGRGINEKKDQTATKQINLVVKVMRRVPTIDMICKIVFIVPSLVGAAMGREDINLAGEIGRGAKRLAGNVSVRNENHTRLYLRTGRTPSLPNYHYNSHPSSQPFHDSLCSSQCSFSNVFTITLSIVSSSR